MKISQINKPEGIGMFSKILFKIFKYKEENSRERLLKDYEKGKVLKIEKPNCNNQNNKKQKNKKNKWGK